ncbi:MAG: lytic transglycosylase domain-containing protein [Rhodothalassiaceae bacterium]
MSRLSRLMFLMLLFSGLSGMAPADEARDANPSATAQPEPAPAMALPALLSIEDRDLYRRIFDLQEKGEMKAADRLIARLEDPILMGHVLYQRYMHPSAWRSRYAELRDWLAHYGDHPGAERVYRLARKRQGNAAAPKRPMPLRYVGTMKAAAVARPQAPSRDAEGRRRFAAFETRFQKELRRGRIDRAEKRYWALETAGLLAPHEHAEALGRLAHAWYLAGDDEKALALGAMGSEQAPLFADSANWYGGLAAFRLGHCDMAETLFGHLSQAPGAGAWLRAAGGFWAGRAAMRCGRPGAVSDHLRRAADEQDTFYGLIAARLLGIDLVHDWSLPTFGPDDASAMLAIDGARRAIALHEIGMDSLADAELRLLLGHIDKTGWPALAALAAWLNLPGSQLRIAEALEDADMPMALGFPLPDWEPDGGFTVDRALLFAFIRQESRFATGARSRVGASGLMQVMPATASFISGDRSLRSARSRLYEPQFNMALGQQYIEHLAGLPVVEGNLFMLAAAYNAGPGNLARWKKRIDYRNDPLLFIESLPARETRDYIEHVMANLWLYRLRLGQETRSLDAVAANAWPLFETIDGLLDEPQISAFEGEANAGN